MSENTNFINDTTDAMSSLAYLGNIRRGKSIERERETFYQDNDSKKSGGHSTYKWLFAISILGILYFLYNIKSQLNSPFTGGTTNSVGEQAEMLTPVERPNPGMKNSRNGSNQIFDQGRMGKFETRKLNPVRPASNKSFMETQSFQDSNNSSSNDNGSEDNNYYYDNAAPMELDPVRAQISKENFDNGGESSLAPDSQDGVFNQEISN